MYHDMLHVISARCVACDLHMIAPGPLECTCWRCFAAQWGDCKKSQIASVSAIIIIIISWASLWPTSLYYCCDKRYCLFVWFVLSCMVWALQRSWKTGTFLEFEVWFRSLEKVWNCYVDAGKNLWKCFEESLLRLWNWKSKNSHQIYFEKYSA